MIVACVHFQRRETETIHLKTRVSNSSLENLINREIECNVYTHISSCLPSLKGICFPLFFYVSIFSILKPS